MRVRSFLQQLGLIAIAVVVSRSFIDYQNLSAAQDVASHGTHASEPIATGSTTGTRHSPGGLTLSVDGAKTPDKVPDHVAYRHFLMAMAETADAPPERIADRNILRARVGLSAKDTRSFVTALITVREQMDAVTAERRVRGRAASASELATLKQREDQTIGDARARIRAFLSIEGQRLLTQYVREQVKPHIVIYGDLPR